LSVGFTTWYIRTINKNWDVTRQDGGEIADGRIACRVALSSIFAKTSELAVRDCCLRKEGDTWKQSQAVLEHQMALQPLLHHLLLRFSATDHGDGHFREKSLEKVTRVHTF
jgi:hypothetical protein